MSDPQPSSIQHDTNNTHSENKAENNYNNSNSNSNANNSSSNNNIVVRRERPARECTKRAAARLQAAAAAEAEAAAAVRKKKSGVRKERLAARLLREEEDGEEKFLEGDNDDEEGEEGGSPSSSRQQCSKIITQLVGEPEPSQLPRWNLRSMWQLASILNFLNVFRPLLNIRVEFSAEEFETALITPNDTLGDIHMPLLKAIPPVTRVALGHNTWITVLCRKLRDWWHWVAEGELPIVASHGAEIEAYNALDPAVRVVILKALCDIRVEVFCI
uniref:DDT domain-containing protein DDR4-like n=1 Tax=Nicotiana tabacum TaxID=4097 RepID=A0A1S4BU56_TOBAC|nr:PREDICTED: DDT domain-containing protein DDR4-like [Nicotiana tabacum]